MTEKHIKKKSVLLVICEISVKITIDNTEYTLQMLPVRRQYQILESVWNYWKSHKL